MVLLGLLGSPGAADAGVVTLDWRPERSETLSVRVSGLPAPSAGDVTASASGTYEWEELWWDFVPDPDPWVLTGNSFFFVEDFDLEAGDIYRSKRAVARSGYGSDWAILGFAVLARLTRLDDSAHLEILWRSREAWPGAGFCPGIPEAARIPFATCAASFWPGPFQIDWQISLHLPAGDFPVEVATIPWTGAAIPEPATWALLVAGFGLVGSALRRHAARRAAA